MSEVLPSVADLLADLVALPGPPGQEDAVRDYLAAHLTRLGIVHRTDAKGNLLASSGGTLPERPSVVVTAHMDEIALMVTGTDQGSYLSALRVAPMGGVFPWKWGEGPVEILPLEGGEPLPAVLSFGSIHTASPHAAVQTVRDGKAVTWDNVRLITGETPPETGKHGTTGCRVVMARDRRRILSLENDLIASYFFDDRADCVSWLLALEELHKAGDGADVLFVATVSEEVGGEGAQFALRALPEPPAVCIALEIGPNTPDNFVVLDANPTLWVSDSFSTMDPKDIAAILKVGRKIGRKVQLQAMTRGGSDATCSATRGLCARPVTLAFAAENSHGFEIMHKDAPESLAKLLVAYLRHLAVPG